MKAIVLISGGLDSSLAVKLIQNQGIEVLALHFLLPFLKYDREDINESTVRKIVQETGCRLQVVELKDEYLNMLEKPNHGYGKNFNPCIDCKILMLKYAKKTMVETGAKFIVSGEVLGQRPMSQNKSSLRKIELESNLEGLLLRPLSALLLPETVPEKRKWVNRKELLNIKGRSRRMQIRLARKFNIKTYSWPDGGCFLTDPHFSRRLKDMVEHKEYYFDNIGLLKVGRHFRVNPSFKLVVGRNEKENKKMVRFLRKGDLYLEPLTLPGPTAIGRGVFDKNSIALSGRIVARYTAKDKKIEIKVKRFFGAKAKTEVIGLEAIDDAELKRLRI